MPRCAPLRAKVGPAAVPALIEAVRGDNEGNRKRAVEVLGMMGPDAKDAIPVLVGLLQNVNIERKLDLVSNAAGIEMPFEIEEFRKYCLLNGLDDISLTMRHTDAIRSFEQQYYEKVPWLA